MQMTIFHYRRPSLQLGAGRYGTSRAMCQECGGRGEKLREKDQYVAYPMS
jgi:hypothetical protein